MIYPQVYVVAGGQWWENDKLVAITSAEILVEGESSWKTIGDLPGPRRGPQMISNNNKVIVIGRLHIKEQNDTPLFSGGVGTWSRARHDVLELSHQHLNWTKIGEVGGISWMFGASIVPAAEINDYCQ